ncbi:MAG: nucleoside-diphosphate kinase [Candidatus Yanofskybacteria bacterium RIFCSPHIGHO2_01_FULL_45_42]|uniref:Nucleoside diphosphate kinase n=3 Tax=Candidatus Yanofskyibacteriota TaxID=1752733 RepID=A0A1F8H591_9BACT|nr:MAG: nucleoside-diphosphate kinase [Candidatus Yanofskybacteria bacterium RIFCSPHIGHO2_01_FULL_45_42]OGN16359.1 MAG: nucleoside-diphosphate kinase [Candidatus Yanofskybacteria bacterium RIFCSPHIGHO2_02_FULL_46_19]OGN26983.1 MAG: nucleoside-diphosphate kinase [Candidatus Yanofskybacteria bacterium RIFCSPLOWO2_01_FULL_45_72]OGN32390.1 MAG: nucleoside-diphosphate kinase [Candidatus Yanofskybacteria bacterium RIFCSPLOWO2_02_FULL_45_18]
MAKTTKSKNIKSALERTLVLLKPDALDRGIMGEIISRFEKIGAKFVGMKMLVSDKDTAKLHYTDDLAKRRGEKVRKMMIEMLISGPIVAVVLEGIDIIEVVRKMVGATEPKAALPGTIRGDFAHISYRYADEKSIGIFNLIHASDSPESAKSEIAVWFKPEELVSHKPGYTKMTLRED